VVSEAAFNISTDANTARIEITIFLKCDFVAALTDAFESYDQPFQFSECKDDGTGQPLELCDNLTGEFCAGVGERQPGPGSDLNREWIWVRFCPDRRYHSYPILASSVLKSERPEARLDMHNTSYAEDRFEAETFFTSSASIIGF
jgi:hypothetical protein